MKDNKFVILCVDDDKDILDSIKIVIESSGLLFEGANSAEEALKKYKKVQPDALIVDLMMEEVDSGINLAKELKLIGNEAPVYLLSSVGDELHSEVDYSTLGLTGVMQKPLDHEKLINTLKDVLG